MRLAALALAALIAAPSLAAASERGDGRKTTTRRDVPAFHAIRLDAPLDAAVKVGGAPSVAVTIDSNLQELVRTRVEDGTLVVALARDAVWDGNATVEISVPALQRLGLHGTGDVQIDGGKGELTLELAGTGDLDWRGSATALTVALQGTGNVSLQGKADRLAVSLAGSGDVRARALTVRAAEVTIAGSGDVDVRLFGGTVAATIAGSGTVRWAGEGKVVRADVVGSGAVVHEG